MRRGDEYWWLKVETGQLILNKPEGNTYVQASSEALETCEHAYSVRRSQQCQFDLKYFLVY